MYYEGKKAKDVKIAYIGGGSKAWAWIFMSDLAANEDISGRIDLYDIDFDAAYDNEIIGNKYNDAEGAKSHWDYRAVHTLKEALTGADFVIISILPGTFDEMESDVHLPEEYGVYQSVGDTTGPGGVIRALRTIPMMEEIALAVKEFAPKAWVLNYTNPMAVCVDTLYQTFPEIKAYGCCHEVFGTQNVLMTALEEFCGIKNACREDIRVNVIGVNHFTWLTEAKYRNTDVFPVYRQFCEKYRYTGHGKEKENENWLNKYFKGDQRVKIDLFLRYGVIAAAGDRHLAEFCPGQWYLKDPETVEKWGFSLTPVSWRKALLSERIKQCEEYKSGKTPVKIEESGEEGVNQIRALLGLQTLVTNVNLPNRGQIKNLPLGAVVETNAVFSADSVIPVLAGEIPQQIYPLISRMAGVQHMTANAGIQRDIDLAFHAFVADPLVGLSSEKARELFERMLDNTKKYLSMYEL